MGTGVGDVVGDGVGFAVGEADGSGLGTTVRFIERIKERRNRCEINGGMSDGTAEGYAAEAGGLLLWDASR